MPLAAVFFILAAVGFVGYYELTKSASGDTVTPDEDTGGDTIDTTPPTIAQAFYSMDERVQALGNAISHAEGYGVAGAIPTKYNNPGDLKPPNGASDYWQGQTGVGTGGHAIFATPADGFSALYRQVNLWRTGKSNVIFPTFTFQQAAQKYAEDWQPWLANVTRELGVQASTTLGDYFNGKS